MSFGIPVRNGLGLGLLASTSLATRNVGFTLPVPTLNLDFTTMTALPSTITFSRPSNATYYDSTGKLTYAPNNLLTQSNTFTNAAWAKPGSPTIASGVTDPLGGTNAWTITNAAVDNSGVFQNTGSSASNNTLGTFWLRRRTGTGNVSLFTSGGSVGAALTLTGSWQQFTQTNAPNGSGFFGLTLRTIGDAVDVYAPTFSAVTYETTPRTQDQVITTSAKYYGPRLDYNPATLAARGLLIEEARTNLCLRSEDFTTTWTAVTSTITANSIIAPDGLTTADTWTSGSVIYPSVFQTITVTNSTPYTATFYAKAGTSSTIDGELRGAAGTTIDGTFNLSTGVATVNPSATVITVVSMVPVGSGWYRCSITKTSTSTSFLYIIGQLTSVIGNTVYLWGAQFEAGSFATSYIPTAASSVARSADTASMTGTNFSSWYNATAGAFLVQFDTPASGTRIISAADDNTANNNIQMLTSGTDPTFLVTTSGTAQASIDAGTVAANTVYKFAGTYSANDFAACISGGTVGTDTSGTIPTVDQLRIGAGQAGNTLCGHIALLVYYPQRLPNATLQSLTS
jgi:hypothetical protein